MKNGEDRIHLLDMEALYEQAPTESELRKLLVYLFVWAEDVRLEPSPPAPHMLRDLVSEFKRKYDPAQKSPLMDVWNYYAKGEDEDGVAE